MEEQVISEDLLNARKALRLLFSLIMHPECEVTPLETAMRKDGRFEFIKDEAAKTGSDTYRYDTLDTDPVPVPKIMDTAPGKVEREDLFDLFEDNEAGHVFAKYQDEIEELISDLEKKDLNYRPGDKLAVLVACALFGYRPNFTFKPYKSTSFAPSLGKSYEYTGYSDRAPVRSAAPVDHEMGLLDGVEDTGDETI